jgi:APA family basic amino acid/polyamine antiporter
LSCSIGLLFMPFSPAALIWPYEWAIVGGWWLVGFVLMFFASGRNRSS